MHPFGRQGWDLGRDRWVPSPPALLINHEIKMLVWASFSFYSVSFRQNRGPKSHTCQHNGFQKAFPPIFLSCIGAVFPHAENWHLASRRCNVFVLPVRTRSLSPVPWSWLEDSLHADFIWASTQSFTPHRGPISSEVIKEEKQSLGGTR